MFLNKIDKFFAVFFKFLNNFLQFKYLIMIKLSNFMNKIKSYEGLFPIKYNDGSEEKLRLHSQNHVSIR
jgi:hypothetical protein